MNRPQIQPSPFKQTNAFAMNYALPFGIYWVIGLLFFTHSLQYTLLSLAFYFVCASVPIIAWFLLSRFRDKICGGVMSFGRGYLFTVLLYFYASIILAAATWVYFQFFDHGAFIDGYLSALNSPEIKEAFEQDAVKQITGGAGTAQMRHILENLQSLPTVVYAANALDINIFLGLILAIPTALLAMRREGKDNEKQ